MSNHEIYRGSNLVLGRDSSRAGRAISRRTAINQVRLHEVQAEADVITEKVAVVTDMTGQAMGAVVRVAQGQKQLELLAPEASGRLSMLADDHAMTLTDLMSELRRGLRRL